MSNLNPWALRFFQGILIALCGIFSGYTLYELVRPYPLSSSALSIEPDKQTVVKTQTVTNSPVAPLETFSEIIERPLFMENRRPFVPPVSTGSKESKRPRQAEPDISTQISLSAIVIADEKGIALIENKRDRKLQKLQLGETYNGWTLSDIQANHIAMQKGPETRQIKLVVKPSRPGSRAQQETKPADAEKQFRIASPENVAENGDDDE